MNILTRLYINFIKFFLNCLIKTIRLLLKFSSPWFNKVFFYVSPLLNYILFWSAYSILVFLQMLVLLFIAVPLWFFYEVVKPQIIKIKTPFLKKVYDFFYNPILCAYVINNTIMFFKKYVIILINVIIYIYFYNWKKLVDFFFYNFKRNIDFFARYFFFVLNFFFIIVTFLLLQKINAFVILHNFFFGGLHTYFFEKIFVFKKTTWVNVLQIFVVVGLNPDYMFLLLYILFMKIGIWNCFSNSFDYYTHPKIGFWWNDYTFQFKLGNPNFSFIDFFLKDYLENPALLLGLLKGTVNTVSGLYCDLPLFFLPGLLFFTTVVFSWLFFSYLGAYGIYKLNLFTLFLFWSSLLFYIKPIFVGQKIFEIKICNWVFLGLNVRVDYYFLIDTISYSFILLTTSIALFVFVYAFSYFKYEPLVDRFLLFILSFVVSMLFLVSSGNTIMLFLGWELIGFTSFCLINFWTTKTATLKSAFKAFTFNKVSDFFLFMFLLVSFNIYYTFDILSLNNQIFANNQYVVYFFGYQVNSSELLALFLVGAAFIKSAQLGGHVWLPDSMEAPVPASSLIHSATLVSAGVYLILRFNFIFDSTEFIKVIIPVVGSLTAAYGGVCAIAQSDIKKTLAYSTISHCGFLMVLCSTEMNEFTILYLYVHGFFKAGVFMCVGNVLRITRGYQDTRRMGGLLKYLPFEYYCATIGLLNLAGLPFTFGFFIKHLLLISLGDNIYMYYIVIFNSLVGAFAGIFYSYKLIFYTFNDIKKGDKVVYVTLNKQLYNSYMYTNASLASVLSILFLFLFAYILIFYLLQCFLYANFLFSDCVNTTITTNYFSINYAFAGSLLNFSFMNIIVIVIINYFVFSRFRKTPRNYNLFKQLWFLFLFFLFFFIFYNIV